VQKPGFGDLEIQRFQNPFFQLLYDYDIFLYELQRLLKDLAANTDQDNVLFDCIVDINDQICNRADVDVHFLIQNIDLFGQFLEKDRKECEDEHDSNFLSDCISRLNLIVTK